MNISSLAHRIKVYCSKSPQAPSYTAHGLIFGLWYALVWPVSLYFFNITIYPFLLTHLRFLFNVTGICSFHSPISPFQHFSGGPTRRYALHDTFHATYIRVKNTPNHTLHDTTVSCNIPNHLNNTYMY